LDDARQEMLRLVLGSCAAITQAVIDDALQGKYLSAKFLFEAVGLSALKDDELDELEDATQRESLASFLLKRWEIPAQQGRVTEVSETTPGVARLSEAPVES